MKNQEQQNDYEKEEWMGWKIVSEMLNHPDENGIYPTSECYQKLYEFVIAQKNKALAEKIKEIEGLKITKKKGVMEMIFGDGRKDEIRIHTNMDEGYNQAIDQVLSILKQKR